MARGTTAEECGQHRTLERADEDALAALPEKLFQSRTAEVKNWAPVASSMNASAADSTSWTTFPATVRKRGRETRWASPAGSRSGLLLRMLDDRERPTLGKQHRRQVEHHSVEIPQVQD